MKNNTGYCFHYKYYCNHIVMYNKESKIINILINGNYSDLKNQKVSYRENDNLKNLITRALRNKISFEDLPIVSKGTNFQRKVWEAIYGIPEGEILTYKDIGKIIDNKGYRAIGQACKRNPFPVLIPCHRVVAKNGIG